MSKTVDLQIEKSSNLINGLRKNIGELDPQKFNNGELDAMAADLKQLAAASKECDEMREVLSKKVNAMNDILSRVKVAYADKKKIIKTTYPQEQWTKYGVTDKR